MPKAIYIPWTESEEELLLGWLAQHKRLSWEEKSEKYTDDFGMPRTPESLRGKYNQLLKGIRRQRVIPRHFTTSRRERPKQARRKSSRRRSTLQMPTFPPRLGLRDNDAAAEQKLEGLRSNSSFVKKGLNLDRTATPIDVPEELEAA
ncbi:hypothetical protein N7478_000763 [Penicillium angulare]|uniref:uncharacterized protein n=1 Tax=Penicillium angulare TaxID=116970 RepID=UPI002541F578|nr:uncharacterized protein N7478_000763 [Penicillium angulare]KAJ5291512.1 hypothetical protein N7478_000763 [Penicillium angulare]